MGEYQKELFGDLSRRRRKKNTNSHLFENNKVRISLSYEQIGLFIIVFVIFSSVIFTLGVERGKKLSIHKLKVSQGKIENTKRVQPQKEQVISGEIKLKKDEINNKEESLDKFFTVQVVTYKKNSLIEKEINYLKDRGFDAFIIKSGKYNPICVGKFRKKEQAEELLKELKKRYKDCFVKEVK